MVSWPEIQAGIFAGESGGDYGALYGYSNRPGGAFEGVNLQDMTVGQVADFTSPSGPYGQWVKGQVGRVATPVGAYQVVGTTLRDAIKAGAVDPSQPFNRETQDRLGRWIYETQGTGAWEGYRGPQPSGGQPMQVSRGQPMEMNMAAPQPEQRPRRNLADIRDRLILALEGMTLNPNQGLMQVAASGLKERAEGRQSTEAKNRTAEWLRSQGRDDLAQAVMAGALGGRDAATLAYQQPKDDRTATMKNYDFYIEKGMSPEEAMQAVRSGTIVNVAGDSTQSQRFGNAPEGTVWAFDAQGQHIMEDMGDGIMRPRTIPLSGTAAEKRAMEASTAEKQSQGAAARASDTIALIESIVTDPRLEQITGMFQGRLPAMTQAGEDLNIKIEQLKGKAFLEAFESLKGGGQITEREGQAAQNAMARLQRTQSTGEYIKALRELQEIARRGLARARGEQIPDMGAPSSGGGFSVRGVID